MANAKEKSLPEIINKYSALRKQLQPAFSKSNNDLLLEIEILLRAQAGDFPEKIKTRKPTHKERVAKYLFS